MVLDESRASCYSRAVPTERFQQTSLEMSECLPEPEGFGEASLLIFDEILLEVFAPFDDFARRFPYQLKVQAGEGLKDLALFPERMARVSEHLGKFSPKQIHIVAAGGGSVGDFSGFVASILKRGVRLSHVPTTWLAALDSAHGGKTALNVGGAKNQIGTFYCADRIFLIRPLLLSQGHTRGMEALGEAAKMALIVGGERWEAASRKPKVNPGEWLWENLDSLIAEKNGIVREDPFDRHGIRAKLNLGHTVGHIFEAHDGIAHGTAVGAGLHFSLAMGEARGGLGKGERELIANRLRGDFGLEEFSAFCKPIDAERFEELLLMDKKRDNNDTIAFVYVYGPGEVVVESTPVELIMNVAQAEGLCR